MVGDLFPHLKRSHIVKNVWQSHSSTALSNRKLWQTELLLAHLPPTDCSTHRNFQTLFLIFQYLTANTTMHFQLLNTDVVANGEPMNFCLAHRLYIKMDILTVTSVIG